MPELPQTLSELIDRAGERFGERPAIIDGPLRLSYAGVVAEVRQLARGLIASGVQAGDRVAIWSPNTAHWITAALAIHSAGAVLVPLNTRFTGREAFDLLERTRARVLFLPDAFLDTDYLQTLRSAARHPGAEQGGPVAGLPGLELVVQVPVSGAPSGGRRGVIGWDELLGRGEVVDEAVLRQRRERLSGDDVADIIFTSGTTGRPKGAMSSHRQAIAVADAWAERAEVTERDVYLIIAPFFHTFGYKAGWVVAFLRGAAVVPAPTFNVEWVMETVARERVTLLPGPPTIFQTLLTHPDRSGYDLSSLRLAVTGSAPVPVTLIERMRRELTFETIHTAYGLTEAVVVTMCRPGDDPETVSTTSGCPTAGFEVRIVDAEGRELGPGEDGEIQVRGPNVMLGYLDDPEATRAAIEPDGWLHTGDIGHEDERGYVTITDRLKDMLTVGGFNVYPAEVENILFGHGAVAEAALVGRPDERMGEVGVAFVAVRPGHEVTEAELISHCRENLANFKVPREIRFVDVLPRNAGGKVLKVELRERVRQVSRSTTSAMP